MRMIVVAIILDATVVVLIIVSIATLGLVVHSMVVEITFSIVHVYCAISVIVIDVIGVVSLL